MHSSYKVTSLLLPLMMLVLLIFAIFVWLELYLPFSFSYSLNKVTHKTPQLEPVIPVGHGEEMKFRAVADHSALSTVLNPSPNRATIHVALTGRRSGQGPGGKGCLSCRFLEYGPPDETGRPRGYYQFCCSPPPSSDCGWKECTPLPPPDKEPTNFVVESANILVCDFGSKPRRAWQEIVDNRLGVQGMDLIGHHIGTGAAGFISRFSPIPLFYPRWVPIDVVKQTLCGKVYKFFYSESSFLGFDLSSEADLHHEIIPDPPFAFIVNEPKPMFEGNEWKSCEGVHDCLQTEITPDEHYYENQFNSKHKETSRLVGHKVCTYGPWVRDIPHMNRPEIHPSELFWWREALLPGGPYRYWLMLLQDDSNRYDREIDFDFDNVPKPPGWRPWSAFPRKAEFRIAFELDPTAPDPPLIFRIDVDPRDARNIVTSEDAEASEDTDDGKEHALEYDGKVLLKVQELQSVDGDIGVRFVDLCRNSANTRLQGYISITSKVGRGDRGDEGYHTIKVEVDRLPYLQFTDVPVLPPPLSEAVSLIGNAIPQSLHREAFTVGAHLLGDVQVQANGGAGVSPDDLIILRVEFVTNDGTAKGMVFQPNPQGTGGIVKDVPVSNAATLRFVMKSGAVQRLRISGLASAPEIESEKILLSEPYPLAWPAMVTAAGALPLRSEPPTELLRIRQWQLDTRPFYAPLKDGQASSEDESPFAEEINEAILTNNEARLQELFGTSQPFQVAWSFQATNLIMGTPVLVKVNEPATPTEVQVQLLAGRVPNGNIRITFPAQPASNIYELKATAQITDTNDFTGTVQHRLWSHVLSAGPESVLPNLLPAIAEMAKVSADNLVAASALDLTILPEDTDSVSRIARMVRLAIINAVRDRHITVGELGSLIRGAKQFVPIAPPKPPECDTFCFRSVRYYLLNLHNLPRGVVHIVSNIAPVSTSNTGAIELALKGNTLGLPPFIPTERFNREFVAAQLSSIAWGGLSSPTSSIGDRSMLACYGISFAPVELSNGVTITPSSMLKDLFGQALAAMSENRAEDMGKLADVFALLNGDDPRGRCGR